MSALEWLSITNWSNVNYDLQNALITMDDDRYQSSELPFTMVAVN